MNIRDFIFIHIPKNAGSSITKALRPFGGKSSFSNHRSASEIIEEIGVVKFQSFFSFAIVRNPWDRQVSLYNYILRDRAHHLHQRVKACGSFKEYIKQILLSSGVCANRLQKDYVCDSRDFQLVKYVGRFETLQRCFEETCMNINLPDVPDLPKLNVDVSAYKPYQDRYDKETREIVEEVFEPDISIFGYNFV